MDERAETEGGILREIRASIFITCLVDQIYPQVGEAMVTVLRQAGVALDFPAAQTCCGQPAFNSGFRRQARELAERFISIFDGDGYVVAPSGSCTSMVRVFYPELFKDDPQTLDKARALSSRLYEFSEFLVKVVGVEDVGASYHGAVTYHPSCHLLRELGVRSEPVELLKKVRGIELRELKDQEQCCGFGGTFSVKYPEISGAILQDKLDNIRESGALVLVSNDSGCLMHIAGGLTRQGLPVRAMHLAELLAQRE
ncbi:MAG: (Fe-S)-binding protein [Dehalococcoidia bacterium]